MSNFNRKLKKLKRDPKKFFADMHAKHEEKMSFKKHRYAGSYQYTVVSAVYNVEKYLDDYFKGFVAQTLSFKNHIKLVLVDDGSTDKSADIIRRWQNKYPDNIIYIYKENGGQASARNIGLKYVNTKWVTFVDPDDFIDSEYFLEADKFLVKNKEKNIRMIGCHLILFIENKNLYRDNHPLKYRFASSEQVVPYNNLGKNIQLSASTAFFLSDDISNKGLFFDERVKPNFEDAQFIAFYLASQRNGSVGFVGESKYFYRKREDGSSTLDTSWEKEGQYTNVLKHGCLQALKNYKEEYGYVPKYFQRTVLYHITWYVKYLINKSERISFLSEDDKIKFEILVVEIFDYIDDDVIIDFELAGCWFYFKVGMLNCFKNKKVDFQIAYIEDYDINKRQVLIRYFTGNVGLESFKIDGQDQVPAYTKTIKNEFVNRVFAYERQCWVPLPDKNAKLSFYVDGVVARLSFSGKHHRCGVLIREIENHFIGKSQRLLGVEKYNDCWILMDRDTQADDNAEHLYRYIKETHPEKNAFFVLRKKSHDWKRLEDEGFNLLAFGSKEHELALNGCDKIISSHADVYVMNYFRDNSLLNRDFVFLQHGVTQNDMSGWFNSKKIAKLVVAAKDECNSIVEDRSKYKFSRKEVALTGFPRHDGLLNNNKSDAKSILVMPTWRQNIVGKVKGSGNSRELNPDFIKTSFAKHWYSFLHSNTLQEMAEEHGYEIVFFPHANIQPYLKMFNLPKHIRLLSHAEGSIQKLFQESSLMITDYSSVAFEMAYLDKPILYYQFDKDEVFSGGHICSKGYFEYERDGFGPVVTEEGVLLDSLARVLENGGKPEPQYAKRMNDFFPFKDGRCCERTFNTIESLDHSIDKNSQEEDLKLIFAKKATEFGDWPLAESRWQAVLNSKVLGNVVYCQLHLLESLRQQGKLSSAKRLIESINTADIHETDTRKLYFMQSAQFEMTLNNWGRAECLLKSYLSEVGSAAAVFERLLLMKCYAHQKKIIEARRKAAILKKCDISVFERSLIDAYSAMVVDDFDSAIKVLEDIKNEDYDTDGVLKKYKPELLLSALYRVTGRYQSAHQMLAAYERHTENDPDCRIQIALLQGHRKNWVKVIAQLKQAYPEGIKGMQLQHAALYIEALKAADGVKQTTDYLMTEVRDNPVCAEIANYLLDWPLVQACWQEVASSESCVDKVYASIKVVEALRHQGYLLKAKKQIGELEKLTNLSEQARALLRAEKNELLMARHQWEDAAKGWATYTKSFPDYLTIDNQLRHLTCLAKLKKKAKSKALADRVIAGCASNIDAAIAQGLYDLSKDDHYQSLEDLTFALDGVEDQRDLKLTKLQLQLAAILRESGLYEAAQQQLVAYERHTKNDPECRIEIAMLQVQRNNWEKVFVQLNNAYPEGVESMPIVIAASFIKAARLTARFHKVRECIAYYKKDKELPLVIEIELAEIYIDRKSWSEAAIQWKKLVNTVDIAVYRLAYVYRVQGRTDKAIALLKDPSTRPPSTLEEWLLKGDLAQLTGQWDVAVACWGTILKDFSDNAPAWVWDRYQAAQLLNNAIPIQAA